MFYTISEDLIFYQVLSFIRRYSNFELKLHTYFFKKTSIYPKNVVVIDQFVFFFVDRYFEAKRYLDSIRREIYMKAALIRTESTLINLLFSLFPDLYIHKVEIEMKSSSGEREISINFLNEKSRAIAIGRNGCYIKAINELFEKYVVFQNDGSPIKIRCKVMSLEN